MEPRNERLIAFAERTLQILEADKEWSEQTTILIHEQAIALSLATLLDGMFKGMQE
tara:strand:+ start:15635 stop:15802 length:168 start_codon:yes stop_codon:yes gene_type:complete